MRSIANYLASTSLVLVMAFAAMPARAADLDATSAIDAVTVYPDGASVTRVITLDLPSGDNTLVAKDFPLTLDPSSLRVEGEAGDQAHDRRDRYAAAATGHSGQSARDRQAYRGAEGSARRSRRRDFRSRSAAQIRRAVCRGLSGGTGREGRGASALRMARRLCRGRAMRSRPAETAIRDAQRKQRDIDRDIARLEQDRSAKPPAKLEVRIDLASAAATKATLRVTYSVRNARWTPALRCPPRHRRQGPQARAGAGAPRRDHAIDRRGLVERDARRLHRADRTRRRCARPQFAGRAISATAALRAARRRRYG